MPRLLPCSSKQAARPGWDGRLPQVRRREAEGGPRGPNLRPVATPAGDQTSSLSQRDCGRWHDDAWRSEQLRNRAGCLEQEPRQRVRDERERNLERETEQERLLDQERRRERTVVRQALEVLLCDEDRGRQDREHERRGA